MHGDEVLHRITGAAGTQGLFAYIIAMGSLCKICADRKGLVYFSTARLFSALGWLALIVAIKMRTVTVVTKIVFSYPIFSILLSWLFLRGQEDLSPPVVIGCILIVVEAILVSLF